MTDKVVASLLLKPFTPWSERWLMTSWWGLMVLYSMIYSIYVHNEALICYCIIIPFIKYILLCASCQLVVEVYKSYIGISQTFLCKQLSRCQELGDLHRKMLEAVHIKLRGGHPQQPWWIPPAGGVPAPVERGHPGEAHHCSLHYLSLEALTSHRSLPHSRMKTHSMELKYWR